ncbi:TauD/TfdA family dioxygenase [Acinetobacter baumannii]|uniref:TauD/TfdA dioxygenase family protein n=1 Tax=Acinetobacter baumannii TaxID=470 RepID=UPI002941642F|nr:TauD/TfdA family dioxygenase [Acinetobacter baumannii]MDV4224817.1 TauD/TfdA family dioxygenase [Acinetobacter baumannii]
MNDFNKKLLDNIGDDYTQVSPLSLHMGIEINNIDISNDESIKFIYKQLIENKIVVLKNQNIDLASYVNFAKKLGNIAHYPFSKGLESHPEIIQIKKTPEQKNNFSGMWHVDSTYLENPPDFTMLFAEITPPLGGDTVFSNSTLAFEHLSEPLKYLLRNTDCEFVSNLHNSRRDEHLTNANNTSIQKNHYKAIHPAIKKHEETGKESIYINQEHTKKICNLNIEESNYLIKYLTDFLTKSEFTLRVKWDPNMIVIWDNRAVQHHAVNDYNGFLRIMNRITINKF